jgi:uncharacterized protein YdaU (DUF1376 family)
MARHKVDIYMPLYVRDFLTSTLGWSAEERGHYLTLLMVAWDRGGLPAELDQIERLSPGVTKVWPMLQDKFPVDEDGLRRNARLEKHRDRCVELKDKRIEAGKRAAAAKAAALAARANGEQSCSNRAANVQQSVPIAEPIVQQTVPIGAAIVKHPTSTSTSTPTSTSPNGEDKHTHTHGGDDFRQPGWAATEWQRFVAAWNVTERAEPWPHLTPPDGWVDLAASPGWLERAREALARLPSRQFFDRPLPVTRFFDFVDRIRAGEFADPKGSTRSRPRQPAGGNL